VSRTGPPAGLARAGGLGAKVRSWSPALMSAAASVLMTVASLAIARFDGFDAFGTLVTLQAVGVILGIPMLWGVHVNASRAMAARADAGVVAGTALAVVAAACLLTSAAFFVLLTLARGVLPVAAADGLGCAAGLGVSATVMTLAESLLRIRGRQVLVSGLRLGCAGGYLVAVAAVLAARRGDAARYAALLTVANAACAVLMLAGLRRALGGASAGPPARGGRVFGWDGGLARTLLREGWVYSTGQSLLTLLFGFDVILLMRASGPAAVGLYALYIGSCRRVIGILFTDSLASLLIAALAKGRSSAGGRAALRYAPWFLGLAGLGAFALVVVGLAAAGALDRLVPGWAVLAAAGCAAHALVIVLFCVLTVQPSLGLAPARAALAVAFLPGLAVQAAGAVAGGVPGMIAAFAVLNIALVWWFLAVIRRAMAGAGHRARAPEQARG